MLIRVVDFETTGFPVEGAARLPGICEIGFTDIHISDADGSLTLGENWFEIYDPGEPIPPEAMAIHHITDEMISVWRNGERANPPAVGLRRLYRDDPDIFCAHNADFERAFFTGNGPGTWLCTYKAALRVWPDAPGHGNQTLRYWLGLDLDPVLAMPPHRAGPDTYVTAHILRKLIADGASVQDMLRWSSGPALLPRVTFGKHKGSRWEDLPTDYLEWIAFKSDMDRDAKANAKHHLKKRGAKK